MTMLLDLVGGLAILGGAIWLCLMETAPPRDALHSALAWSLVAAGLATSLATRVVLFLLARRPGGSRHGGRRPS
jgi:hypothetical protein